MKFICKISVFVRNPFQRNIHAYIEFSDFSKLFFSFLSFLVLSVYLLALSSLNTKESYEHSLYLSGRRSLHLFECLEAASYFEVRPQKSNKSCVAEFLTSVLNQKEAWILQSECNSGVLSLTVPIQPIAERLSCGVQVPNCDLTLSTWKVQRRVWSRRFSSTPTLHEPKPWSRTQSRRPDWLNIPCDGTKVI